MDVNDLRLGMTVYHRKIYNHREPLKLTGIKEYEIEVEGDLSGGTHNVKQTKWLPLKGTSLIYDYCYKNECRKQAIDIEELAKPITDRKQDNMTKTMFDLLDMVFKLTNDTDLNGEF